MIGQLRHRIALESPVETEDAGGGRAIAWETAATVWARIESSAGRDLARAGEIEPQTLYRLTIRALAGVSAAMRVRWGDKLIELASVYDPDGRGAALVLEGFNRSEVT